MAQRCHYGVADAARLGILVGGCYLAPVTRGCALSLLAAFRARRGCIGGDIFALLGPEYAFPSAETVSFENFWLWLLTEYLQPVHLAVAHHMWQGMCKKPAPLDRLDHDTHAFNTLLLREDFMSFGGCCPVDGLGADSRPWLHDNYLHRAGCRRLLPQEVLDLVVQTEVSQTETETRREMPLLALQAVTMAAAPVLLREVTRLLLSRSSVPQALISDHLTILGVSDPKSAHRRALGIVFATLQAMAVEASRPLCPLPHLTRVLRCERTAATSTSTWRLSCSWPLTWPRPRGGGDDGGVGRAEEAGDDVEEFRGKEAGGGEQHRLLRGGGGGESDGDSEGCDVEWLPILRDSVSLEVVEQFLSRGGVSGQ